MWAAAAAIAAKAAANAAMLPLAPLQTVFPKKRHHGSSKTSRQLVIAPTQHSVVHMCPLPGHRKHVLPHLALQSGLCCCWWYLRQWRPVTCSRYKPAESQ